MKYLYKRILIIVMILTSLNLSCDNKNTESPKKTKKLSKEDIEIQNKINEKYPKLKLKDINDEISYKEEGNEFKKPLLDFLISENDFELAEKLLNHSKLGIDNKDKDGMSPLMKIIKNTQNKEDFINKLINKGADVNLTNYSNGKTPLFYAIESRNKSYSKVLLDKGADPIELIILITGKNQRYATTCLHYSIKYFNDIDLVQMFLKYFKNKDKEEKDIDYDFTSYMLSTPLITALMKNKNEIAELLINSGADIYKSSFYYQKLGSMPVYEFGSAMMQPSFEYITPLHLAAINKNEYLINVMKNKLGSNFDINYKHQKLTPLDYVAPNTPTETFLKNLGAKRTREYKAILYGL